MGGPGGSPRGLHLGTVRSTLWVGVLGLALPSRPLPGENRLSAQGGNFWLLSPCLEGPSPQAGGRPLTGLGFLVASLHAAYLVAGIIYSN